LIEYKGEAFKMFMELIALVADQSLDMVFKMFPERLDEIPVARSRRPVRPENLVLSHESAMGAAYRENKEPVPSGSGPQSARAPERAQKQQPIRVAEKVGRNDPCPCGSGKKFKNCHGA